MQYGLRDAGVSTLYISSLYFALTTFSTTGWGDIKPENTVEYLYAVAVMLVGATIFGYVVGGVASLVGRLDAAGNRAREKLDEVSAYLREKRVSSSLRLRVQKHLEYVIERRSAFDEAGLLGEVRSLARRSGGRQMSHNGARLWRSISPTS